MGAIGGTDTADVGEDVWARLHDAGLRVTPLRRQLVTLFGRLGHWVTPQEFHRAAEDAGLRPGLATIYRLIDALAAAGLCRAFPQADHSVRYVYCPPGHHHHLICEGCGLVRDVEECRIPVPRDAPFHVRTHTVDFFGLCDRCWPNGAAPT
ncbi:MAG TPA: Fur family transcriptional regulator [Bacillota bacterium]|nr:Fur family transcriptional regulator [Bacillota bacterium]